MKPSMDELICSLCWDCLPTSFLMGSKWQRKIITAEVKCLHVMGGVTRGDRLKNGDIRRRVGTEPVLNFISRQQNKWFGHVTRFAAGRAPK